MKIDTVKLQKLTGKGIVASDDIIINTSKGDKSITLIREGASYNILNCLDKNTDWFTLSKSRPFLTSGSHLNRLIFLPGIIR